MTDTEAARTTDAEDDAGDTLGLPQATALIMGSIIGTGVFTLPAALAVFGPVSLVAFVIVTVGALALALTFGYLSRRVLGSGGPYLYARDAFGEFAGFLVAWSYWVTAWAGNAAIVVAWVGYVEVFVNTSHGRLGSILIALVGLWVPAAINIVSVASMGRFQLVTTVLKFIPLIIMSTVGLFFLDTANFGPFNASDTSVVGAISAAAAVALFSYLGVETASVAAAKVRNPQRNVPRASVVGTILCAVVYLASTLAIFGAVPNSELRGSTAPYADAANNMFGGTWTGEAFAIVAIISGIGALNGWVMITAETSYAAAKDGLFPQQFASTRRNVPVVGVIVGSVFSSLLVVAAYSVFDNVFTTIVLLSVFTTVVPYIFSTFAAVYWFVVRGRAAHWPRFARDLTISVAALVFSFWSLAGSGYQTVYYGIIATLVGIVLYVYMKRSRGEYGETPVLREDRTPASGGHDEGRA